MWHNGLAIGRSKGSSYGDEELAQIPTLRAEGQRYGQMGERPGVLRATVAYRVRKPAHIQTLEICMMPRTLWITYAWVDNEEGDFDYLVEQLGTAGVAATYDRVALIPGQRLWEQIADRILDPQLDGWAYLLTPGSVNSAPCREELAYAVHRVVTDRGGQFPLIGLLHGLCMDSVPTALGVRLCIDLSDPDWTERVRAALHGRPPTPQATPAQIPWNVAIHDPYQDGRWAVEIRPRLGSAPYWRIAFSADTECVRHGVGPARGGAVGGVLHDSLEGTVTFGDQQLQFVGGGTLISPAVSAYAVFGADAYPKAVAFAVADTPDEIPKQWQIVYGSLG